MVAPAASISARRPGPCVPRGCPAPRCRRGRSWRTRCRRTQADEPRCRHGAPRRGERHPAVRHGPDQAQVVAPVARARLDQFLPARQPRVRPAHRHIRARFVEKDQALGLYRLGPDAERRALGLDARPILLGRPRSFFFANIPGPAERSPDAGAMYPTIRRHAVVRPGEFLARLVGLGVDQRLE